MHRMLSVHIILTLEAETKHQRSQKLGLQHNFSEHGYCLHLPYTPNCTFTKLFLLEKKSAVLYMVTVHVCLCSVPNEDI